MDGRLTAQLARVALERARVLAPYVLLGIIATLVASEWAGIPISRVVLAWNVVAIGAFGVLTVWLLRRRVSERWGHAVLGAIWWMAVGGTLISQYSSASHLLTLVLLVEIASVAIMLHTAWVVVSLAILNAIWIPLAVRDFGAEAQTFIATTVMAEGFAMIMHRLLLGSLVRTELHRHAEAATTHEVASQLAELRRLEDERAKLQQQLLHAQRMEATGTLAAGLAHDMNNVLAAITSFAELLRDKVEERASSDVEQILAQAARGAGLTRGLLAFSRRGQYRKQVVRIDDILRDMIPLFSRTLSKSIEVRSRFETYGACIEGDPNHLGQVLVNLCVNAADAMSGRGTLEISTEITKLDDPAAEALTLAPGRYVHLRVSDTGPGMDEATVLRVFEPFFTTKPIGKGTGLGLSTVWGIVQSHDGAVTIDSRLGQGTTFHVYVPITTAVPAIMPITQRGIERTRAVTVLVADDEPAIRVGTQRLLERTGLEVITAGDGAEALRIFDQHRDSIGLVILDMGMPVMSGGECFTQIRRRSDVPVLVATGYAVESEAQALVAQGATLIEKPYSSKALAREVSRLLLES